MVMGSSPNEVIGFFTIHLILPATPWPRGFTQPLIEMSTRRYFRGKALLVYKDDNLPPVR
jgi:hypothetical protein